MPPGQWDRCFQKALFLQVRTTFLTKTKNKQTNQPTKNVMDLGVMANPDSVSVRWDVIVTGVSHESIDLSDTRPVLPTDM